MIRANGNDKIVLVFSPKIQRTWARTNLSVIINQPTSHFLNLIVIASLKYADILKTVSQRQRWCFKIFCFSVENTKTLTSLSFLKEKEQILTCEQLKSSNSQCKTYVVYLSNL